MKAVDLVEAVSLTGLAIVDAFLHWFIVGAGLVFGLAFAAKLVGWV